MNKIIQIGFGLVFVFCIVVQDVTSEANVNADSYLNALQVSHQENEATEREDFDFAYHQDFNQGYDSYHQDHQGYDYQSPHGPPSPVYGPPAPAFGPPAPAYGPPASEYGPPIPEYGPPPGPVYGPPKPGYGPQHPPPPPIYGPPHHPPPHHPPFFYHHPREHWFLDKFKFKIDLFTIGKLLLKLIIFKKIVKFIALICLLLFLPKLKNLMKEDEEEEGGGGSHEARLLLSDKSKLNERINEVTHFALTAFETFSKKYEGCKREQIWCRLRRTVDTIDAKYPYEKIVKLYLPDNEVASNDLAYKQ